MNRKFSASFRKGFQDGFMVALLFPRFSIRNSKPTPRKGDISTRAWTKVGKTIEAAMCEERTSNQGVGKIVKRSQRKTINGFGHV